MRTGAVVVAAGLSSRMGDFKPMMQMGAMSIISRVIANFQQADVFPIVVVTGFRADELEKHVSKLGVICVRNDEYASTEMFDSAVAGFSFVRDKCDRVFFTPGDIPLFTYDTVRRLMETDADVAKPVCHGQEGHPILLSRQLVDRILAFTGSASLREVIEACAESATVIDVDDEGILLDADTKHQYDKLVERSNRKLFRPVLDVSLMREGRLFDKNAALLLHTVAYAGTVKEASSKIGISYSKAWKMISALEDNLGFPLLERQPGGESGGASQLTAEGRHLLLQYERYVEDIKRYANSVFGHYFDVE